MSPDATRNLALSEANGTQPAPPLWVLIPAKEAERAKSRLAPVLGAEARAVLARLLLARLLTTLNREAAEAEVLVISGDAGLRTIARLFGQHALPDPSPGVDGDADPLNEALEAGRQRALEAGAQALLVLPTDLPWLSPSALAELLAVCRRVEHGVLLAPDHLGTGTNALFQRPADVLPFAFGLRSARRHAQAARAAGLPLTLWHGPGVAHDLDQPVDWQRWMTGSEP